MKHLVLILSLFLSLLGDGKELSFRQYDKDCSAVEVAGRDRAEKSPSLLSLDILPVQEARVFGQGFGVTPSVRVSNSSRRTQISQKFPFRIIKDGKIIDKHHFSVFQTVLNQFPSGIHSAGRYIHTLCTLLI